MSAQLSASTCCISLLSPAAVKYTKEKADGSKAKGLAEFDKVIAERLAPFFGRGPGLKQFDFFLLRKIKGVYTDFGIYLFGGRATIILGREKAAFVYCYNTQNGIRYSYGFSEGSMPSVNEVPPYGRVDAPGSGSTTQERVEDYVQRKLYAKTTQQGVQLKALVHSHIVDVYSAIRGARVKKQRPNDTPGLSYSVSPRPAGDVAWAVKHGVKVFAIETDGHVYGFDGTGLDGGKISSYPDPSDRNKWQTKKPISDY